MEPSPTSRTTAKVSRRIFLVGGAALGGGLLLKATLPGAEAGREEAGSVAPRHDLTAWVRVDTDDTVTLILSQTEIGQGISTTLPAILADELGADWSRIRVENAPVAEAYQNPEAKWMFTGNSESMHAFAPVMRRAGAAAREMLTTAAAARWQVDAASCRTENGAVLHPASGRKLAFGEVAEAAGRLPTPTSPRLRPVAELKLVGRSVPRLDIPSKVDGTAVYGIDFKTPGMVYAAVRQAPQFGGSVTRFNAVSVRRLPGVIDVVEIPNGVAVVAEHFWQAKTAADALDITFAPPPASFTDAGPNATPAPPDGGHGPEAPAIGGGGKPRALGPVDSASLAAQYRAAMNGEIWAVTSSQGDAGSALRKAGSEAIVQEYESPFQAHAAMEPMNCTAVVRNGSCEVWAPTQGPAMTQVVVAKTLGLPPEKVKVNWTYSGGAFGRRLIADFAAQAALLAKAVNRPVKVIWTREEDMTHDVYRPATLTRISTALDRQGRPEALYSKLVSASQLQFVSPGPIQPNEDPRCTEGLETSRYAIPNLRLDFNMPIVRVPTSVLRTTGYGPNLFALESFIDELAHRAGADPYQYRRDLLRDDPRALAVLDAVAKAADWATPPPSGRSRGIAYCDAFGTLLAQVIELSVDDAKVIRLHRVATAADPARVYDPGISTSNLEGGTVWGITSALKSEITFSDGACVQTNFDGYEAVHLWEMPTRMDTVLIDGDPDGPLGGIGEVGPVATVPALTNALFAATGDRIRSLPLKRHGYSLAI